MKLLHTSDWHLGHSLHDMPRDYEHRCFFDWLFGVIASEGIDALILSGDIFDTANPSAQAVSFWFRFLAATKKQFPNLDVVAVGGNHDSASRLDAPDPVLSEFGIRVVGGLPRTADSKIDIERLLVPLTNSAGEVAAWLAAVPFLRAADLPHIPDEEKDPLVEGVRQLYREVMDAARSVREPGQALVITGHCYMTGGAVSELSERKILGGNQHALPADIFSEDIAYGALGHLHLPQTVGGKENVRYCGSPIPLSLAEAAYPNQVCVVELDGAICKGVSSIRVPRAVDMIRVPVHGSLPMEDVVAKLGELPDCDESRDERTRPYLEVSVELERPEPSLRQLLSEALAGKDARLLKITTTYTGKGAPLAGSFTGQGLRDFTPEQVFAKRYESVCNMEPPAEILSAFHELLEQVEQGEVLP